MLINKPNDIPSSEITDKNSYLSRRKFLERAAILVGSVAATGVVYRALNEPTGIGPPPTRGDKLTASADSHNTGFFTDEPKTPFNDVTGYNNYYEFSTDKYDVAKEAKNFDTRGWVLSVEGMVSKPRKFDLDDLKKIAPLEERVYRHRCVEAWSMVIPWLGFPIASLLKQVEPLSSAKYVRFETLMDARRMPNQSSAVLDWPYVEGLRMDEAMHPLAILSVGLYGETLLPQNGAPIRLVVPWKYGFKGCKSIVKISLVDEQPGTTWALANSYEYGFYANVNPAVDHPRWSQATERRLPTGDSRATLPFNGYAEQVAQLYAGMDLRKFF